MAAAAAVARVRGLAQRRDATDAVTLDAAARAYRVQPGGSIQAALEAAAKDPANKIVYVHAGTYRPAAHGQALIWFNDRHDGITLEATLDCHDVFGGTARARVAEALAAVRRNLGENN